MMIHSQTVVCEFIALCVLVLLPIVRPDLASQSLPLWSSQCCGIHEECVITLFLFVHSRTVYVCMYMYISVCRRLHSCHVCPCRLLILILPLVISALSELQELLFSIPSQYCRIHCESSQEGGAGR